MLLPLTIRFSSLTRNLLYQRYASLSLKSDQSRLFTKKHEWISMIDDGKGRVGISNHAQESLGDVVYVQLPDIGAKVSQFEEVGAIESVKAASELLTPVSGKVISTNKNLEEKPGLVNSDCYGEGWLYEIELEDTRQLDKLMDEKKYNSYLEESK